MKTFMIDKIQIGDPQKPLVIPEIGINHGGDLSVAKQMVMSAHRAGARLIKHQTHVLDDEMCCVAKKVKPGNTDKSIYRIMQECSLSEVEEKELKEYTESLGLVYLSTPFSRKAADRLVRLDVSAFKIGSGELNNYPLIEYVAQFGKPMIISTGMNDLLSVEKAVKIIESAKVPYALLHTTNVYPTKPNNVRLGAMQEMMKRFPDVPVGLSDHTTSNAACIAALTLGANIVERHFTDTKERSGPDIVCSMDEEELRELLVAACDIPQMIGGEKKAIIEEIPTIDFAFASVVSIKPIRKGSAFTYDNIWVKRPKGGIPAEYYEYVIGKIAKCDIDNDVQITSEMVIGYEI